MPIIFEPKKSFGQSLSEGLSKSVPKAINEYLLEKKEQKQKDYKSKLLEKENEQVYKDTGIDISNLTTEKSREATITNLYKQLAEDESINKLLRIEDKKATDMPSLTNPIFSDEGVTEEGNEEVARAMPFWDKLSEEKKAAVAFKHPQVANALEKQSEFVQRQNLANEQKTFDRKQAERKEQIDFHKESADYDKEIRESAKRSREQLDTVEDVRKAIKSGNIKPSKMANIFKGMGKIGDKIAEAFTNEDQATLQANIPRLLEGWKDIFGVRLSDADLKLLENKLPSIGKDPQANEAVLKVIEKYAKNATLREEIGRELKAENKGLRPLGYADKVEEEFQERTAPEPTIPMISPKSGKVVQVPQSKVDAALKSGGKLAQ